MKEIYNWKFSYLGVEVCETAERICSYHVNSDNSDVRLGLGLIPIISYDN